MLGAHPAVEQVAVVGAPDPVLGEIGVAFVVPAGRATDRRRGPVCWPSCGPAARASLADYKAPDRVVVVDALPLTSMMKVDKRALADRAAPMPPPVAAGEDRRGPMAD